MKFTRRGGQHGVQAAFPQLNGSRASTLGIIAATPMERLGCSDIAGKAARTAVEPSVLFLGFVHLHGLPADSCSPAICTRLPQRQPAARAVSQ